MQKFNKYDLVRVAKDLGKSMQHFTADCDAIIIGSYHDQFGDGYTADYTIHIKGKSEHSWYHESQLTLVEPNRKDLLEQWVRDEKERAEKESDLNWIFENGKNILGSASGSSISALAKCFGLTNLWGNRGEGFVYYENAMMTLALAKPFLESGDKDGWLKYCETIATKST